MSAIAAVFGPFGAAEAVVRGMLARMPRRGADTAAAVAFGDEAVLGMVRSAWELEPGLAGPMLVAQYDHLVVGADASLYYQSDLRDRLTRAGVAPSGSTPSHLILDAYRAWGPECASRLEGDYAFVVWDIRRSEVFCCRDGIGLRPLHYGVFDKTLVVASTVAGVLAHPHASEELNPRAIAATVAGQLYSLGSDTSFRHVHVLPAGHAFTWRAGALAGPHRHWSPTPDRDAASLSFSAAADKLRALLTRAVDERLPRTGTAAVWMSGGWDSTSVFASGREALRLGGRDVRLRPVCISYPEGDPGREDDLIRSVLNRWDTDATWLDSRDIPLLEAPERAAAERDEASALLYGPWNGALAAASRSSGARVAFDGNGGDQLFGPSFTHLTDLFATGRWAGLAGELWARSSLGWRDLARLTVLPLVPRGLLPATAWLRPSRQPISHFLERAVPDWVRPEYLVRDDVLATEQSLLPAHGWGVSERERQWMITAPFVAWGMSQIAERALSEGVELRSPLLDRRLIEFALARPWHERARRGETKRLLRAAMAGLLPADVLAPRTSRTGITTGYSRYWMRERLPGLVARMLEMPLVLETLGMVDGAKVRRAAERLANAWVSDFTRVHLYHTIEVELWLRARLSRVSAAASPASAVSRDRQGTGAPGRSHVFHFSQSGG